ncbi:uncharacterized protein LOC134802582 [Cydia splendana]|uniref:uncharacterized protein LOC134802582 n=1 Tax=Cydia splendana TaxID=1100963 RepID=UPI00300CB7E6
MKCIMKNILFWAMLVNGLSIPSTTVELLEIRRSRPGSVLGLEIRRIRPGSGPGQEIRSLPGSGLGKEMRRSRPDSALRQEIMRSRPDSGLGLEIRRIWPDSGLGQEIRRIRPGSGLGQEIRRSLPGSGLRQEIRRSRPGSGLGLEIKRSRPGSRLRQEIRRSRPGSRLGQEIRRSRPGSGLGLEIKRSRLGSGHSARRGYDSDMNNFMKKMFSGMPQSLVNNKPVAEEKQGPNLGYMPYWYNQKSSVDWDYGMGKDSWKGIWGGGNMSLLAGDNIVLGAASLLDADIEQVTNRICSRNLGPKCTMLGMQPENYDDETLEEIANKTQGCDKCTNDTQRVGVVCTFDPTDSVYQEIDKCSMEKINCIGGGVAVVKSTREQEMNWSKIPFATKPGSVVISIRGSHNAVLSVRENFHGDEKDMVILDGLITNKTRLQSGFYGKTMYNPDNSSRGLGGPGAWKEYLLVAHPSSGLFIMSQARQYAWDSHFYLNDTFPAPWEFKYIDVAGEKSDITFIIQGVYTSAAAIYCDITFILHGVYTSAAAMYCDLTFILHGVYTSTAAMYCDLTFILHGVYTSAAAMYCDLTFILHGVYTSAAAMYCDLTFILHGVYRSAAAMYCDLTFILHGVYTSAAAMYCDLTFILHGVYTSAAAMYCDLTFILHGVYTSAAAMYCDLTFILHGVYTSAAAMYCDLTFIFHGVYTSAAAMYCDLTFIFHDLPRKLQLINEGRCQPPALRDDFPTDTEEVNKRTRDVEEAYHKRVRAAGVSPQDWSAQDGPYIEYPQSFYDNL